MSTLRHFKLMAKSLLLKYKNKSAEPAGARGEGAGSEVRYCFFALFLSAIIRIWTSENTNRSQKTVTAAAVQNSSNPTNPVVVDVDVLDRL